jgi:hypothetical protein
LAAFADEFGFLELDSPPLGYDMCFNKVDESICAIEEALFSLIDEFNTLLSVVFIRFAD